MSADLPYDTCRSCPAAVVWCVTETGRRMLVNRAASEHGNLEIVLRDGGQPPLAKVVRKVDRAGRTDLHLSHFATCSDATAYRKRGQR